MSATSAFGPVVRIVHVSIVFSSDSSSGPCCPSVHDQLIVDSGAMYISLISEPASYSLQSTGYPNILVSGQSRRSVIQVTCRQLSPDLGKLRENRRPFVHEGCQ